MNRVIFLDRDGVINVDLMGDYVKNWGEFQFESGAIEALKLLQGAGYKMIIISNQAGVGDGIFTEDDLWEVHNRMLAELKKKGIKIFSSYYCFCKKDQEPACERRKPNIGMFEDATKGLSLEKSETFFIGDKATDIEAGKRFGLKTAFVRTGHGVNDEALLKGDLEPNLRANHLLDAVKTILA